MKRSWWFLFGFGALLTYLVWDTRRDLDYLTRYHESEGT